MSSLFANISGTGKVVVSLIEFSGRTCYMLSYPGLSFYSSGGCARTSTL